MTDPRRALPQIDAVLRALDAPPELHRVAVWFATSALAAMRDSLASGHVFPDPAAEAVARVRESLTDLHGMRPGKVINATGVLLHTNLGRASLADAAVRAVGSVGGATALEYSLADGDRGRRGRSSELLVSLLTGAEDALVVNNNAAALVLVLAALAKRREVIVSRGELVEIGGAFRLPAVMEAAGALLREVGTTNRTQLSDVRAALGPRTSAVLRVHPSNFSISGFTAAPERGELIELCRAQNVVYIEDLGSGLLAADAALPEEPDASTAIQAGADIVCFSGDKLLGGPQAGILAGRTDLIDACRKHPLARALRADKLTLAALDATLWLHATGAHDQIPAVAMRSATVDELRARAQRIVDKLGDAIDVVEVDATIGGGSTPGRTLPSIGIAIRGDAERAARTLRASEPPVIARIADGRCILDLRSIDPRDDDLVLELLVSLR